MSRRYEYRKEAIHIEDNDMMPRLNRMGEFGWHVSTSYRRKDTIIYILARRLVDE